MRITKKERFVSEYCFFFKKKKPQFVNEFILFNKFVFR